MRLYRIPGAYVYGIFGSFGAGKTLYLVEQAIEFAEYHRKSISANFYLNDKWMRRYAKKYKYPWVASVCLIRHSLSFEELLSQENSILLMDEAGVEIFSRSWKNRKQVELDSLFRIRHYKNKLLYAAQDWTQVDIQFRRMTHLCLWVRGFQLYRQHYDPVLVSRLILFFNPHKFEDFLENPINKVKIIYPIVISGFRWQFDLVKAKKKYQYLFASYNSFDQHRTRQKVKVKQQIIEFDDNFDRQKTKVIESLDESQLF